MTSSVSPCQYVSMSCWNPLPEFGPSRRTATRPRYTLLGGLLVLLAACTPLPREDEGEEMAPPGALISRLPVEVYREAGEKGLPVLSVDEMHSSVVVRVFPAGKLARLGHEHVVSLAPVSGLVLWSPEPHTRRADLVVDLRQLVLDDPALRRRFELDTSPTPDEIDQTRENLFRSVLDPERPLNLSVLLTPGESPEPRQTVVAEFSLQGSNHRQAVPLTVERRGERLIFAGTFTVTQSELGLKPFAALGGLLRVADDMEVHFRLEALPWRSGRTKAAVCKGDSNCAL